MNKAVTFGIKWAYGQIIPKRRNFKFFFLLKKVDKWLFACACIYSLYFTFFLFLKFVQNNFSHRDQIYKFYFNDFICKFISVDIMSFSEETSENFIFFFSSVVNIGTKCFFYCCHSHMNEIFFCGVMDVLYK